MERITQRQADLGFVGPTNATIGATQIQVNSDPVPINRFMRIVSRLQIGASDNANCAAMQEFQYSTATGTSTPPAASFVNFPTRVKTAWMSAPTPAAIATQTGNATRARVSLMEIKDSDVGKFASIGAQFVRVQVSMTGTVAGATAPAALTVFGELADYDPASDYDVSAVQEIVVAADLLGQ